MVGSLVWGLRGEFGRGRGVRGFGSFGGGGRGMGRGEEEGVVVVCGEAGAGGEVEEAEVGGEVEEAVRGAGWWHCEVGGEVGRGRGIM